MWVCVWVWQRARTNNFFFNLFSGSTIGKMIKIATLSKEPHTRLYFISCAAVCCINKILHATTMEICSKLSCYGTCSKQLSNEYAHTHTLAWRYAVINLHHKIRERETDRIEMWIRNMLWLFLICNNRSHTTIISISHFECTKVGANHFIFSLSQYKNVMQI